MNGYFIKWKVLNAKDYGNIPQNRERIYIVGFKSFESFDSFSFPEAIELKTSLEDVIDFTDSKDERYYYRKGKQPFYDT
ncbi:DNA cytosine methyltransferase, partial [Staphylococcus warneri]